MHGSCGELDSPALTSRGPSQQPFVGTVPVRGQCLRTRGGSISSMTEQTQQPLEQLLEEIGTQLAWVRDYL